MMVELMMLMQTLSFLLALPQLTLLVVEALDHCSREENRFNERFKANRSILLTDGTSVPVQPNHIRLMRIGYRRLEPSPRIQVRRRRRTHRGTVDGNI